MDIDVVFQIAGVGIIVAILSQLLTKSDNKEAALMVTVAGLIVVFLMVVDEIRILFDTIKTVFRL